jgi:hypothetical protein
MAIQYINTGSSANAGNGDSLRAAFIKVNNNFTYLSTASFGLGNGYVGSRGDIGYTGSRGIPGEYAAVGYTGSAGADGARGYTGSGAVGTVFSGAAGHFAFYGTTGTTVSQNFALFYNTSNQTVYVGNDISPNASLWVRREVYTTGFGRGITFSQHHETPDAVNVNFYRTRGTFANPTIVQPGDDLGEVAFYGWNGTGIGFAGGFSLIVDGAPTSTIIPSKLQFATASTSTLAVTAELSSNGEWLVDKLGHLTTSAGYISVSTNLIPRSNNTYDLGSASKQWRSLYVGTSTIYLGGVPLGISNNQLTVNGAPIQTNSLVTVSNTPPTGVSTGTLWYDDVSGRTYIYYDASWIDTNPSAVGYTGSAGAGYTGSTGYTGSAGVVGYTGSAGSSSGIESTSTLVNGTWTVSLSIDGTLKSPLRRDDTVTATNFIVNYNPVTRELTTSLNYVSSFNTNTLVASAISASTATTAGRLGNLRVVSPPTSLSGTSTNAVGDIAFDTSYFYYCSNTYTSATNVISLSQLEEFTNPTATIHFTKGAVTPEVGWLVSASLSTWTITGVVDNGYPANTWSVGISGFGNGFYSLATGTVFTMTNPNPGAIWKKTPWSAITSTGTVARATTATYASIVLTEPTPTSSTSTGVKGQIAVSSTSMYVCVATNSWLRFNGVTF